MTYIDPVHGTAFTEYEIKAIRFADRYGVRDFKVKKNIMTYREYLPNKEVYKATVNLDTMTETRKRLWERKK